MQKVMFMPKTKKHKKIYLEDFPHYTSGEFANCINWQSLNNNPIRFEYEDICDIFTVKYFNKTTEKILVEYKGNECWCYRSTFKRNNISRIIGVIQGKYRYNIGDLYATNDANFTIVDRKKFDKKKMYKYICNNCGFDSRKETYYKGDLIDYWVSETNLKNGISCPCCGKKNTYSQPGINDIVTTDMWLVPYFQGGRDEAKRYVSGSVVKKNFICPESNKIKNKQMSIYTLHKTKTLACPFCSDGYSYPEKFVACFLQQINEPFETQYSPKWANGRKYDFYLPNYNLIIEVDGGLGHGKKTFDNKKDLIGKEIDDLKDELAISKGECAVIRINADKSSLEYLKKNILLSLEGVFDMNFIDWNMCEQYALGSLLVKVCNEYNKDANISNVANKFKISEKTTKRYLNRGFHIGLCKDYHIRHKKEENTID